jgi:hypothetical protein
MEASFSFINESSNDSSDSALDEFSQWRVTTSIILVNRLALSIPIYLVMNASVLVTIRKTKSLRTPINLIHSLLLSANCAVLIPDVILTSAYIPTILRYCRCSAIFSSIYLIADMLYYAFQPLNFAALGIFQLLIIKGKKHLVTYKAVGTSITISTVGTVFVTFECIALINSSGAIYICRDICPQTESATFPGTSIAFIIHGIFLYLPSLVAVIVCTTWSCIIFKNRETDENQDNQLNKRMISIPLILPLALFTPTFGIIQGIERLLESSTSPTDYPYWAMFARFFLFQFYEILGRIVYPVTLLLLNPTIGHHWKEMIFRKCTTQNQVSPASTVE